MMNEAKPFITVKMTEYMIVMKLLHTQLLFVCKLLAEMKRESGEVTEWMKSREYKQLNRNCKKSANFPILADFSKISLSFSHVDFSTPLSSLSLSLSVSFSKSS